MRNIIIGGTFDHFHKGHKSLIDKAFECGEKITIGITSDEMVRNKILSRVIEPFHVRKTSVVNYLEEKGHLGRLIELNDMFGTTKTEKSIDAIVISKKTKANAVKINDWRQKNGFPEMIIIEIPQVLADDGGIISSERIRSGEIDREGKSYLKLFNKTLTLPQGLRKELRKPMGQIISNAKDLFRLINKSKHTILISVGDVVVHELIKAGIEPDLKIIDFKTRRKKANSSWLIANSFKKYANRPGTINIEVVRELNKIIKINDKKQWFVVDGEEDLLALPAILLAPLNSLVVYGQYEVGVVTIRVTEEIKGKVKKLVEKFVLK